MTSPDRFSTDKTFSPSTIHTLQDKSKEAEALNAHADMQTRMDAAGGSFLVNILSGFLSIGAAIGSALADLAEALFGDYNGSNASLVAISDGQLALRNRVELLGNSGYAAACMSRHYRIGRASDRALPFDTQIGPANDAALVQVNRAHEGAGSTLRDEWCIRLDRAGLWQALTTFSHVGGSIADGRAEIVVLNPDLTVYSYTTLPFAEAHNKNTDVDFVNTGLPIVIAKTFVVPTPGYFVQVRWRFDDIAFPLRTARGGARLSQFSVTQWSDETSNMNAPEDAIGTIVD